MINLTMEKSTPRYGECQILDHMVHNAHCRQVESLNRGYAIFTTQCHMCALHYIALSDSLPLTGDINPKTSHYCAFWRFFKMITTDHLVRRITVCNFTHMSALMVCKFWSVFYLLMVCTSALDTLPLLHCTAERPFCMCQLLHICQLLSNPSINLELEYIFGKAMKHRFQRYIVQTEILSTFHAWVNYISVTKYDTETIGPMGQTT